MLSSSFRKYCDTKKKINLFTLMIKMKILFSARTIITLKAHASSVSIEL